MTIGQALITYFVSWWIVLLFVLPIGLSYPEKHEGTEYKGAPEKIHLKKKFKWTTLLAGVVTVLIYLLLESGIVPLRDVIV